MVWAWTMSAAPAGAMPGQLWWRAAQGEGWTTESRGRLSLESMRAGWLVRRGAAGDRIGWSVANDADGTRWQVGHLVLPNVSWRPASVWSRAPDERVRSSLASARQGFAYHREGAGVGWGIAAVRDSVSTRAWASVRAGAWSARVSEEGRPTLRFDTSSGGIPFRFEAGGPEDRVSLQAGGERAPWAFRAEWRSATHDVDAGAGVRIDEGIARGLRTEVRIERGEVRASTRARATWSRRGKRHHGLVEWDSRAGETEIDGELATNHGAGWRSTIEASTDRHAGCTLQRARGAIVIAARVRLNDDRARSGSATLAWKSARLGRVRVGLDWTGGERGRVELEWAPTVGA